MISSVAWYFHVLTFHGMTRYCRAGWKPLKFLMNTRRILWFVAQLSMLPMTQMSVSFVGLFDMLFLFLALGRIFRAKTWRGWIDWGFCSTQWPSWEWTQCVCESWHLSRLFVYLGSVLFIWTFIGRVVRELRLAGMTSWDSIVERLGNVRQKTTLQNWEKVLLLK